MTIIMALIIILNPGVIKWGVDCNCFKQGRHRDVRGGGGHQRRSCKADMTLNSNSDGGADVEEVDEDEHNHDNIKVVPKMAIDSEEDITLLDPDCGEPLASSWSGSSKEHLAAISPEEDAARAHEDE